MEKISFLDDQGTFVLKNPEEVSCLYFPLAGEGGLKSAITPGLGGDCKLDQESFLLEPVSAENLHTSRSTRNFWCVTENGCWSATGVSAEQEAARFSPGQDESTLKAGLMWQTTGRVSKKYGLRADITSFVPVQENVEIMHVQITNTGKEPKTVTGVAAVPIYGRSADNIRDHRNVTSMLHRIRTTEHGVLVKPTMSFDEKGHRENHRIYYVLGAWELKSGAKSGTCREMAGVRGSRENSGIAKKKCMSELYAAEKDDSKNDTEFVEEVCMSGLHTAGYGEGDGNPEAAGCPEAFYPTVERFIGEGGTFLHPRAVYEMTSGAAEKESESVPVGTEIDGKEAMGGLRFPQVQLAPGQSAEYIILLGISEDADEVKRIYSAYNTVPKVQKALEETKEYWQKKVNVRYHTGNADFDRLMRWVSFQPYLRRIYGCSFLPHHDYGRGGRGWRDLWQDCLSLLLMEPGNVRTMILDNFAGTRIDGTNATIIGSGQGEFIADRNGISRVWMDHGVWPFMTTRFYIDQTGDIGILLEKMPYFKDAQAARGTQTDEKWDEHYGMRQRTVDGQIYEGTVLEHLLLQNLCAFYEVGAHNIIRLRGADWNDALDMAAENGESVAFTCAYAGNLRQLAECLRILEKSGICGHGDSKKMEPCDQGEQPEEMGNCGPGKTSGEVEACVQVKSPGEAGNGTQRKTSGKAGACDREETGNGAQGKLSGKAEPSRQVELLEEIGILLAEGENLYTNPQRKRELLERYLETGIHTVSGRKRKVDIEELADNLDAKADWLMRFLRSQEWIDVKLEKISKLQGKTEAEGILRLSGQNGKNTEQPETVSKLCGQSGENAEQPGRIEVQKECSETAETEGWFNSYYDNHGRAVEGITDQGVRMMLTGQVFAVMSGTASEEQVRRICRSADHYLYDAPAGGYRLNTDFKELKFDMGRMFGFAYGEKENGAVFSHMTVMYANALYQRGFVREGYRALQTLADAALDFETSKIYPGIPEYFNNDGRGMYHYLTGAGSWYMMTMITQVFGVRGKAGDLVLEPKLVKEQFDESGTAKISLTFAGKKFEVIYHNPDMLDYGEYVIESVNSGNVLIQAEIICGRKENKPDVKIFCDAAENRADTENTGSIVMRSGLEMEIMCAGSEDGIHTDSGDNAAAAEIRRTVSDEENFAAGGRAVLHRGQIHQFSEGRHEILVELAARK